MILKKCYVSSFGKLKDKTFTFENGINTIKEENGAGKTTLSIFIKSMFYGLDDGKRNIKDNERKKFQPWNSSDFFGGYVDFSFKENDYRIERFFGKKESEDTVKLIDLATMKEYKNNGSLGERLFGIDKNGFLATCFMGQSDFINVDSESVISKFNNICETNNSNTYEDAFHLLENESKKYKQRGEKGLIFDKQKQIYSLNQEIENLNSAESVLDKLKQEQKTQEDEISFIKNQIKELSKSLEIAGKIEATKLKKQNYDNLLQEKQQLVVKKEEIFKSINGKLLTESEYNSLFDLYNDFVKIKNKLDVKKETQKQEQNEKKPFSMLLLIPIILGIIGVVVLRILLAPIYSIIGGVLLALFICFILVYNFKIKKEKLPIIDTSEEENLLSIAYKKMQVVFNDYGCFDNDLINFLPLINKVKDLTKDYNFINSRLNAVVGQLEKFSSNVQEFGDINNSNDYAVLSQELNNKNNILSYKIQQLEIKKRRIDELDENCSKIKDLEAKRDELVNSLREDEEKFNIIIKTLQYLERADENLKIKYREPLTNSLNKYLGYISPNYSAVIDTNLNIKIEEKGALKESDYYSRGYQDLFEICKRFALIDVLFTNEKPFIILDDVFFNLDDEKIKMAIETIKGLAENYQIIYFVCHESRRA